MKEIILNKNKKNWEKLEELLETTQEGCTIRTLEVEDVKKLIEKIESKLNELGLPKTHRNGLAVHCNPFLDNFPQSYKYDAIGTQMGIVYTKNNWRVLSVYRANCKGNNQKATQFIFTDDQKEKILNSVKYTKV